MAVTWLILSVISVHSIFNYSLKFLCPFRNRNSRNVFLTSFGVPNRKTFFMSVVKSFLNPFKKYFYLTVNHYKNLFFMLNQNILGHIL